MVQRVRSAKSIEPVSFEEAAPSPAPQPMRMAPPMAPVKPKRGFFGRIRFMTPLLALLLIVAIVGLVYFGLQIRDLKSQLAQSNGTAAADQAKQVVDAVGKLMILPTDETPSVATVSDPSQLANQPFFQNAKKGDMVLIYNKAKKAILYDPTQNKIIDVAPSSIGSASGTTTTEANTTANTADASGNTSQ